MWPKSILIAGIAVALTLGALRPVEADDQPGVVGYSVLAFGFRIGTLKMSSHQDASKYSVEARFRTTGLTRLLRDMGFVMTANGRRSGLAFSPLRYDEQVNTGQRTSSAQMRYVNSVPILSGGKVSDGESVVLDPATQGGTIDPLTALFLVLRAQPGESLCRIDQPMFDGARRSQIRLMGKTTRGDTVICDGYFQRIAGYSAEDLANRREVAFEVTYQPGPNGLMQARDVRLQTTYGQVALTRR
jgi:Protein of unknown function (DUF3108)